jgi:hypothetical protein
MEQPGDRGERLRGIVGGMGFKPPMPERGY